MKKYWILSLLLTTSFAIADAGIYLPNLKTYSTGTVAGSNRGLDVNVISPIIATNPSVSATGAAVPGSATYLGGNNAGNIVGLLVGQQTMANSLACVLPSDQSAIPVTGTFWQATQPISAVALPLPTGAATLAKQPALGTAGTASADVITVQGIASMTALKVDGSGVTQPISAASLPLPTGASTEATLSTLNGKIPASPATTGKQDTGNTSLASIDGKTPALGQTTKSGSSPVTIASDQLPISSTTTTGALSSLNSAVTVTTNGYPAVGVVFSGTWSGTLSLQGTIDGSNWSNVLGNSNQNSVSVGVFGSTYSPGQNGSNIIVRTDGYAQFRVAMTSYTSGTANVTVVQTLGQGYSYGLTSSRFLDGSGNAIVEGQATMSQSFPVTIASDQIAPKTYSNTTASVVQSLVVGNGAAVSFSAPANAVSVSIEASSSNTQNLRCAAGTTATTTLGMRLEPGRSIDNLPTSATVTCIAEAGSGQEVDLQWVSR